MSDFNEYVIQIDRKREVRTQFFITYEHLEYLYEKYGLTLDRKAFMWEDQAITKLVWCVGRKSRQAERELWDELEAFSSPRTESDRSDGQACRVSKHSAKNKLGINA